MENVFITPHAGGYCDTYVRDSAMQFERSLAAFVAGTPEKMINRDNESPPLSAPTEARIIGP